MTRNEQRHADLRSIHSSMKFMWVCMIAMMVLFVLQIPVSYGIGLIVFQLAMSFYFVIVSAQTMRYVYAKCLAEKML